MKKIFQLTIILFFTFCSTFAQPGGGPPPDPGEPVPISGIEWLFLGGTLLGIRRLIKGRKPTNIE